MRHLVPPVALFAALACATVETVQPPEPPKLEGEVPAIGRRLDLEVEGRGTPVRLQGVTGRVTAVCVLGKASGPMAAPAAGGVEGGAREVRPAPEAGPPPPTGADPAAGSEPEALQPEQEIPVPNGAAAEVTPTPDGEADADLVPIPAPPPEGEVPRPPARRQAPDVGAGGESVLEACERVADALADRIAVVGLTTDPAADLDAFEMRTFRDPGGKALRSSLELEDRSQVILVDQQGRVAEVLTTDSLDRLEPEATRLAH